MHQEIQLDMIPFTAPAKEAEFAFYTAKQDGYCSIYKVDLNGAIEGMVYESELHYGNWLCTNIAQSTKRGYHFPVKISFFSDKAQLLNEPELINQLIDQVYLFSRTYWKRVRQQNLAVTIKYPEMVAEIFPYFTHDKLPDHGKESLWFL